MECSVFPDIIIHKRGKNDKNILIIEVKKAYDRWLWYNNLGKRFDYYKLQQYMNSDNAGTGFSYDYGCFIEIGTGTIYNRHPIITWFN